MSCLLESRSDFVLTLTLNRPDAHNAMSPQLVTELDNALERAKDDSEVRAIIIAAAGGKSFCAGGDLKLTIPLITGARKPQNAFDERLLELTRTPDRPFPIKGDTGKPIIAAIEGAALGGGLELALSCDLIVAGRKATFAAPEVSSGAYPARLTFLLPQRLPHSQAMHMLISGSPISAEDAYKFGMLTSLVEPGHAIAEAESIARRISHNAPISVRETRRVTRLAVGHGQAELERVDAKAARTVYATDDAREGPRAFAEKKRPVFRGK